MKYKAILFDMDGTLVPMEMEAFTKTYFGLLAKKLLSFGIETQTLIDAVWAGTGAMVNNDGSCNNETAFWERFCVVTGLTREAVQPISDDFYRREFDEAKAATGENPLAAEAIRTAAEKARHVVLATNPLFPMDGQITRMRWVGLTPEMFDLVTCYESDCYCKPNQKYYLSICDRLGVQPSECLMIGNDENEDMDSAASAGMDCYLVTDCVIPCEGKTWQGPRGSFADMIDFLKAL